MGLLTALVNPKEIMRNANMIVRQAMVCMGGMGGHFLGSAGWGYPIQ